MAPRGKGGGGPAWMPAIRLAAFALAILSIASAFAPMTPSLVSGLHWVLTIFAILEAGMAIAHGRKAAVIAYAVIALLMNPIRPFHFAVQVWRLLHAGAGIWIAADHVQGRG